MDADRILDLVDRAVAANWTDPFRHGNLIELPPEGDLLFSGDLHGSMENFTLLLRVADLKNHPGRHLILHEVVHQLQLGQDQSFRLLEKTAALKVKFPDRVHVLIGNHELAEIQGREIYKGGICLNLLFDNAIENAYGPHKDRVKDRYLDFLKTMPLAVRTATRIFISHSTPEGRDAGMYSLAFFRRPPEPEDFQPHSLLEKVVWGRDYSPAAADAFAKAVDADVFLSGHTPCAYGYNVPNERHIVLDSKDRFATYILLSLEEKYTHEELKERVRFLRPKAEIARAQK
ncbi:MAG: metallophosphoesterase [Planctomycetota bacterium]